MKDILNIARKWYKLHYQKHRDDTISIQMWIMENPEAIFYHQENLASSNQAYILGIQLPWQKKKLLDFGHNSVVACDATFSTNKYKVKRLLLIDCY